MHDYGVKPNLGLHDLMETADPDNLLNIDMGGSLQHTDEETPGDEPPIIGSSSTEDYEHYYSDVLHYVFKKLL